jgi:RNA polymerase sigma factor (sigma-70 family)
MPFAPGPDPERVFDKPGVAWSRAERAMVMTWLNVPPQLPRLVRIAGLNLGYGSTPQDAEEAWQTFCVRDLGKTIDYYDPARGKRFLSYLSMRLAQVCWEQGALIRKRGAVFTPLDDDQGRRDAASSGPPAVGASPEVALVREESYARLRAEVSALPAIYRVVVELCYFEDQSISEIMQALDLRESAVKVRLFRARQLLRDSLERGKGQR